MHVDGPIASELAYLRNIGEQPVQDYGGNDGSLLGFGHRVWSESLLALYGRTYLRMSDENHTLLLFVEKSLLEFVVEHNRPILRRVAEFPLNEAFAQV